MKSRGISLITLIITVVIIIILAAAVILTLTNKNPINDANLASVMNNRDLMQNKILFHVSKKTAELPEKDLNAKTILIENNGTKIIDDTVPVIEVTKDGKKIKLYRLEKNKYKDNIKEEVAEKPSTGSEWHVDEYGNLFLVYDFITSVPNYMKDGDRLSKNVEDFVIVIGSLLEKSIIESTVIGDKASNGMLECDFSNVDKFDHAKLEANDSPNKLGTDENNYSKNITEKKSTVDLEISEKGNKYVHVLVITEDKTVEIVKKIEITKPADIWDGETIAGSLSGSGTELDPYIISTAAELVYFRNTVNKGNYYSGKYIKMINDIDLNNIEWTPISTFKGIFDGGNNNIYNMKITVSNKRVGLFGTISDATIKNILVHGEILGEMSSIGGIVGHISGNTSVINCKNYVNISTKYVTSGSGSGGIVGYNSSYSTSISDCANYGNIEGRFAIGGIIGYAGDIKQITNSHNEGNISGSGSIGGIVGHTTTCQNLRYCYNAGSVTNSLDGAGGIIGNLVNTTNISDCYNLGDITAKYRSSGIVGYGYSTNAKIYNCYNKGNISVTKADSKVYGAVRSGGLPYAYNSYYLNTSVNRVDENNVVKVGEIEPKTEDYFIKSYTDEESVAYLLNKGVTDDTRIWTTVSGVNGGYPILKWQVE